VRGELRPVPSEVLGLGAESGLRVEAEGLAVQIGKVVRRLFF